jgi:hypothetical protein
MDEDNDNTHAPDVAAEGDRMDERDVAQVGLTAD